MAWSRDSAGAIFGSWRAVVATPGRRLTATAEAQARIWLQESPEEPGVPKALSPIHGRPRPVPAARGAYLARNAEGVMTTEWE